jgi:hypothetical protein
MANFTYITKVPNNPDSWIDVLRVVELYFGNLRHYDEIHFTEPKKAQLANNLQPHVTFIRNSFSNGNMVNRNAADAIVTHWYLIPSNGHYIAELRNFFGKPLTFEESFAQKVIDDAVELGWINPPLGKTTVDEQGFTFRNSKKSQKTNWKKNT